MKRTIIFPLLLVCAASFAQNLNPEVQVTNDYVTKMMDVEKQKLPMSVPDSMLKFDYHFDYTVFDSPYKGAYEFMPYTVAVNPERIVPSYDRFYLRAGAGYGLHPELLGVWAPFIRDNFEMSVHEDFSGYYGTLTGINPSDLTADSSYEGTGYDLCNHTGVEGRWNLGSAQAGFEVGYDGIFDGGCLDRNLYNSAFAKISVGSSTNDRNYFFYDGNISYRFLSDLSGGLNTLAHELALDATIGPVINAAYRILVDVDAEANGFNYAVSATPRFQFSWAGIDFSAGVRLGYAAGFSLYPDVRASLPIAGGVSKVYASVSGRDRCNSFSSIKNGFHRYSQAYGLPELTREHLNASAGICGSLFGNLQYDFKLGGKVLENAPLFGVDVRDYGYAEALKYANYKMLFSELLLAWKTSSFDASGHFLYGYTGKDHSPLCFMPSAFSGNAKFIYNVERRIFAGVLVDWATKRSADIPYIDYPESASIPGYADLSVYAEYKTARNLAFWAKGGNLLGMDIRRSPFYSEKGPYFTAGICLSL